MPLQGEVELSPTGWVRKQTQKILDNGTTDGVDINGPRGHPADHPRGQERQAAKACR
jgi:hypothetical protein